MFIVRNIDTGYTGHSLYSVVVDELIHHFAYMRAADYAYIRNKNQPPSHHRAKCAISLDVVCDEAQSKSLELNRYDERFCSYDRFFLHDARTFMFNSNLCLTH